MGGQSWSLYRVWIKVETKSVFESDNGGLFCAESAMIEGENKPAVANKFNRCVLLVNCHPVG